MKMILHPELITQAWDNIEVHPIGVENDVAFILDTEDEGEIVYWSVYVHLVTGGIQEIADCPTKDQAIQLATLLGNAAKFYKDNNQLDY